MNKNTRYFDALISDLIMFVYLFRHLQYFSVPADQPTLRLQANYKNYKQTQLYKHVFLRTPKK